MATKTFPSCSATDFYNNGLCKTGTCNEKKSQRALTKPEDLELVGYQKQLDKQKASYDPNKASGSHQNKLANTKNKDRVRTLNEKRVRENGPSLPGDDKVQERIAKKPKFFEEPVTDEYQKLLSLAKEKGNEPNVPWISCAGNSKVSKAPILNGVGRKRVCNGVSNLTIPFQHSSQWCTLNSLLNVLGASKKKAKKARKILGTGLCGFSDLANQAAGILRVSLRKINKPSISWLLKETSGKYLLMKGVHCISADCEKKIIFDSAKTHASELTRHNLLLSGFGSVDEMRQVVQ